MAQVLILASMDASPKDPGGWSVGFAYRGPGRRVSFKEQGDTTCWRLVSFAVKSQDSRGHDATSSSSLPRYESRTSKHRIHAAGKTWADSPKAERRTEAVRSCSGLQVLWFRVHHSSITGTRPRTRTTGNHGTPPACGTVAVVCRFARVLL
jgi:hypothetical protein